MKRTVLISAFLISILMIVSAVLVHWQTARTIQEEQAEHGFIQRDRTASPFSSDFYLCGEWEYYPDTLLYAGDGETDLPDAVGFYDPAVISDNQFKRDHDIPYEEAEYSHIHKTPADNYTYVTLPSVSIQNLYHHSSNAPSSYRITVQDLPAVEDGSMTLSLSGLIFGNYEVFINGVKCMPMVMPYGYPSFFFPVPGSGKIEVVIQTYGTASVLNIIPRITYKGLSMVDFDNYRNVILCMASILLTAFVIMMILMFSLERKYLFLPFWVGLLFSFNYIFSNIWATGHISLVSRIIPHFIIPHITWLLFIGGIYLGCLYLCSAINLKRSRKFLIPCSCLSGAAVLLRMAGIFLLYHQSLFLISDLLTFLVLASVIGLSFAAIKNLPMSAVLFMAGLYLLVSGAIVSMLHNSYGFWNLFVYFQPLAVVIYIVLVFINSKAEQMHLLRRTRELLSLEKESTKIQAAMLSSQIQPHFLYNTLTTIQELCYVDADAAAALIVKFSQYLRSNIDFMNYDDLIPFTSELEHIHNFMYIQNARYKDALHFEERIEFNDFLIPPLSVQPFIENAIKHGIMKKHKTGSILLHVYKSAAFIHIVIRNDGEKISRDSLKPNHSIDNIKKRLKYLMNGEVLIDFESGNPETVIEIRIPLNEKDKDEIFNC